MSIELLKSQGAMKVESQALDAAFADTDVKPRQRLISAIIDYGLDMVDCATVEFADPDYRVAKAVRTGEAQSGDQVIYTPWTVKIGYYDLDESEWTTLSGVPSLEVPTFPALGPPITKIKIFSASVMLQKNTTPGGDPAAYLEPFKENPFRRALEAIASHYGLTLDLGDLEEVVAKIDKVFKDNNDSLVQYNLDPEGAYKEFGKTYMRKRGTDAWIAAPVLKGEIYDLIRKPNASDYQYLKDAARIVTSLVQSGVIEVSPSLVNHFNQALPGQVSKSDLRVVYGIYQDKLVFKFARELLVEDGFKRGIPIIDYRIGNNLLISFAGNTVSSNTNSGGFANFLKFFAPKNEEPTKVELEGPKPDAQPGKNDDPQATSINVYTREVYRQFAQSLPLNAEDIPASWLDYIKRSLDTNIQATIQTYGIPRLMAGQLIGCTGLGYGPEKQASEDTVGEQGFANYNRVYLINQATHRMDQTGFYSLTLKVGGCSLDGSEERVIDNLLNRISSGIEPVPSKGFFLWRLLGFE